MAGPPAACSRGVYTRRQPLTSHTGLSPRIPLGFGWIQYADCFFLFLQNPILCKQRGTQQKTATALFFNINPNSQEQKD